MKIKQLFFRVAALKVSGTMHGQDVKQQTLGNSLSTNTTAGNSTHTSLLVPTLPVCARNEDSRLFTFSFIESTVAMATACTHFVVPQFNTIINIKSKQLNK